MQRCIRAVTEPRPRAGPDPACGKFVPFDECFIPPAPARRAHFPGSPSGQYRSGRPNTMATVRDFRTTLSGPEVPLVRPGFASARVIRVRTRDQTGSESADSCPDPSARVITVRTRDQTGSRHCDFGGPAGHRSRPWIRSQPKSAEQRQRTDAAYRTGQRWAGREVAFRGRPIAPAGEATVADRWPRWTTSMRCVPARALRGSHCQSTNSKAGVSRRTLIRRMNWAASQPSITR